MRRAIRCTVQRTISQYGVRTYRRPYTAIHAMQYSSFLAEFDFDGVPSLSPFVVAVANGAGVADEEEFDET